MRYLCFFLLLLFFPLIGFNQSEEAIYKKALSAFEKNDFESAKTDFLKLISIQPKNATYNYYYGVSLLKTSTQSEEAVKYLKYASDNKDTPIDADFYLGKAYHLDYRFDDAIRSYQRYKSKYESSSGKRITEMDVDREMEMCKDGKKAFSRNITDVIVRKKQVYAASEFFRLYDENEIEGSILVSSMDQSKIDKKKGYIPIIFYPANSNIIFFASYGEKDNGNKDIYYKIRTINGEWSSPKLVDGDINTNYDEDFPFYDEKNEILYFSSKGHNSIGGYDIFSSKFNRTINRFEKVKNLDFAISSTYDDLFYIPNKDNTAAWFASNRDNKPGYLTIYQVAIDRLPSEIAFIRAEFSSEIYPELKQLKVELINLTKDKNVGTYFTQLEHNNAILNIPLHYSGDYLYRATIQKLNKSFDLAFTIPHLTDRTEYRQELIHKRIGDKDFMELILLEDKDIALDDDRLLKTLKEKSNLDVSDDELQKASATKLEITHLKGNINEIISEVEKIKLINDKLNQKIVNNIYEINQLKRDLRDLVASNDDIQKMKNADALQARRYLNRIESIEEENKLLLKFSDSIAEILDDDYVNTDIYRGLNKDLQLIPDSDTDSLGKFKEKNQRELEKMNELLEKQKQQTNTFERSKKIKKQSDELNERLEAIYAKRKIAETELANLEANLPASKKKEQTEIANKIEDRKEDIQSIDRDIDFLINKKKATESEVKKLNEVNNLWTSISQVQVKKEITKEEVQQIIEKSKDTNFNSIRKVVEQIPNDEGNELAISVKNESTETNRIKNEVIQQQKPTKQFIEEDVQQQKSAIQKLKTTNDKKTIQKSYNDLIEQITIHEKAQEKLLQEKPNDKEVQKQHAELKRLKQQLEDEKISWEKSIEQETIQKPAEQRNQKEWIASINPNYEEKINQINQKEFNHSWEKIAELKESESDLLKKVQTARKTKDADSLEALEKNLIKSVAQLEQQFEHEILSEIQQASNTAISSKKAINQLNFEVDEAVFNEEVSDLGSTLQKKHKQLAELQKSIVKDDDKQKQIQETLSELEQTSILLDDKRAEYRQLLAAKNQQKANEINSNEASNEDALLFAKKKSDVEQFILRTYPSLKHHLEQTTYSENLDDIRQQYQLIEEEINSYLKLTRELISANSQDNDLINYQSQLSNFQTTTLQERKTWEASIKELQQIPQEKASSKEELIAKIDPKYKERTARIEQDKEQSEWSKSLQLLNNDQLLLEKVKTQRQQTSSNELDELYADLEKSIDKKKEKINKDWVAQLSIIEENIEQIEKQLDAIEDAPNGLKDESKVQAFLKNTQEQKTTIEHLKSFIQNNQNKIDELEDLSYSIRLLEDELVQKRNEIGLKTTISPVLSDKNDVQEKEREEEQAYQTALSNFKQQTQTLESSLVNVAALPNNQQKVEQLAELKNEINDLKTTVEQTKGTVANHPQKQAEMDVVDRSVAQLQNKVDTQIQEVQSALETIAKNTRKNEDILIDLNDSPNQHITNQNSLADKDYIPPHETGNTAIENVNQQIQKGEINEIASAQLQEKAYNEIRNEQLIAALKEDTLLKTEIKETIDDMSSVKVIDLVTLQKGGDGEPNLRNEFNETYIPSANKKEFLDFSINKIDELDKRQDPTIHHLLKEEKNFDLEEIRSTKTYANIQKLQDDDLLKMYNQSRMEQLENIQEETNSTQRMVNSIFADAKGKDKKIKVELEELLDKKASYLSSEISIAKEAIQSNEETQKDYEIKFYELEEILIHYHKSNAEQLVLYQTIEQQIQQEKAISQKKREVMNELLMSKTNLAKEKALSQLEELQELSDKNVQQIRRNLTILEKEIEQPTISTASTFATETTNFLTEPTTIKRIVEEQAFQIKKEHRTVPTINAEDLKLVLEGEDYPKGLFFRVQVGAFAKPINENVYSDFSPITMERLTGQLIKYMAGYFTVETKAATARDQIRHLGFKDAFIVAYCDGVRIPVHEARRKLQEGTCVPVSDSALFVHIYKDELKGETIETMDLAAIGNVVAQKVEFTRPSEQITTQREESRIVQVNENELTDAATIHDLFFTVQVGVFNRYVESDYLKGLKPINTFEVNPKAIRHSVGIFDNIEDAKAQRLEAIDRGFTDAFVVAYMNGKRYLANEALNLLAQGKAKVIRLAKDGEKKEEETISMEIKAIVPTQNYASELKNSILKAQKEREMGEENINSAQSKIKKGRAFIQFEQEGEALNIRFYWWLTNNNVRFNAHTTNGKIILDADCDEYDFEDLLEDFEELQFQGIQVIHSSKKEK